MKDGPQMVIDCLLKAVGPKGTLVMPTHSNNVLGAMPYDAKKSQSNTGIITEHFRKMPGVLRSNHATHSVVALGPAAAELTSTTSLNQAPLAREGFWGKLYDMDGDILMMCKINSATIFHVGETWTGLPQLPLIVHAMEKNKRNVYILPNAPWHDTYFTKLAQPLIKKGVMTSVELGESKIWIAPARAMADISVKANKKNPHISIPHDGECICAHCQALKEGLEKKR
ncbi:MAG: AAC(3) family N-acetyltransferase [Kiritimatiellae bacterium]|nr:AAC(3) family N-acetyltransferase [Kiritimatiellia bacterium]